MPTVSYGLQEFHVHLRLRMQRKWPNFRVDTNFNVLSLPNFLLYLCKNLVAGGGE